MLLVRGTIDRNDGEFDGIEAIRKQRKNVGDLAMRRYIYDYWVRNRAAPGASELTSPDDLSSRMEEGSEASFPFFVMLSLSAVLATLGLISNSTATIIGAMIIAPLMSPIMSIAFGIADVDWRLMLRSFITVVLGVVCVIAVAFLGVKIIGARVVGSEILSRTSPSLLDLVVALAAGCAGAYARTRPRIADSIAGVAIAVALVPPLAVTGIGFALGDKASFEVGIGLGGFGLDNAGADIAKGGFLLFVTNFVGIIAIATLILLIQQYGKWKKALVLLIALIVGSYALLPPLQEAYYKIYVKNRLLRLIDRNLDTDQFTNLGRKHFMIHSIGVDYRNETVYVAIDVTTNRDGLENAQTDLNEFTSIVAADIKKDVVIKVDAGAVDILTFEARSDTD
jgi:uncharacterized hydrophobic protein (TIGR00271 family)